MNLKIYPSRLSGLVEAPPSKSYTHRVILCASFANGKSIIHNPLICDDTIATISSLKKLGVDMTFYENRILIHGGREFTPERRCFDMRESASSFRVMLPILSCFMDEFTLYGTPRLLERIQVAGLDSLSGLTFRYENNSLKVSGVLNGDRYYLTGDKTTQLISGMILALPFIKSSPKLTCTNIDFHNPYVQMTYQCCRQFGIEYEFSEDMRTMAMVKGSMYQPRELTVEGDFSNGAYWLACAYLHPEVRIGGLNMASIQGDKEIFAFMETMGITYDCQANVFKYQSGKIGNACLDVTKTPDLAPILASVASLGSGRVTLTGTKKLNYKESNRADAICKGISRMGGSIRVFPDEIVIDGVHSLSGGCEVDSCNDHRIAMALSVLGSCCENPIILKDFGCVGKSYPDFFDEFMRLGGKAEVIE